MKSNTMKTRNLIQLGALFLARGHWVWNHAPIRTRYWQNYAELFKTLCIILNLFTCLP